MVGTESKEKHDELIEEILRMIEGNNLYIKLVTIQITES